MRGLVTTIIPKEWRWQSKPTQDDKLKIKDMIENLMDNENDQHKINDIINSYFSNIPNGSSLLYDVARKADYRNAHDDLSQ